MDEKRRIKIEKILGFKIKREDNPVDNQKEKDDSISDSLGHFLPDKKKLNLVKRIILTEVKKDKKNELLWALIGHIYYLEEEFTKSIKCFLKTISINSKNVDNWIDLGFAYRAHGEFKKSDYIFWNYEKLAKKALKKRLKEKMKLNDFPTYYLEIYPVINGLKPLSLVEVPIEKFDEFKKLSEKEGLFIEFISYEEFLKKREKFSPDNIADRMPNSIMAYISLNKKIAKLGKFYDITRKEKKFGKLLGYPDCCVKNYNIERIVKKPEFIAYTPCSKDCKATKRYLKNLLNSFKKNGIKIEEKEEEHSKKQKAIFEKRKWIGITNKCNNKCIFCLDGKIKNKFQKSIEEIKKELNSGIGEGCVRLVISGGEATIHSDFIEIIKIGKKIGYKKIQVISNGRMFSYSGFLNKAIKAGLDEITFSIHGHNAELHDSLTSVKGSFEQTINGIKKALKKKIIVNCDIVLNKQNIIYFPKIIILLLDMGVREFDLLQIMPFGNAWENKKEMIYDLNENIQYIKEGIEIGKKRGATIWTNRFPPEYLEGYEEYIQDPYKLLDEVRGRKKDFLTKLKKNEKLECYRERCNFCCMKDLCNFIYNCNNLLKQKKITKKTEINEIIITKESYDKLRYEFLKIKDGGEIILSLVPPEYNYQEYNEIVPRIKEILPKIESLIESENIRIKNIPPCFLKPKYRKKIVKDDFKMKEDFTKEGEMDLEKCALFFIENKKIKGLSCKKCKFYNNCDGIFQKYIMKYGFKELKPIPKINKTL